MEEIDCANFFNDFLDFPEDKINIGGLLGEKGDMFTSFWPNPNDILPCSEPGFSDNTSAAHLSADLDIPYEEIVHLEWLSNFVEDSFSGGSTGLETQDMSSNKYSSSNQFCTRSPVSVHENSRPSTGGKNRPLSPKTSTNKRLGRARSKRPRPATFTPRLAMQQLIVTPTTSFTDSSESRESFPSKKIIKIPKMVSDEHKKKKKIKLILPSSGDAEINQNPPSQLVRKCMHCEITKTPQWRAGPMGPKTLCNACGVRHKSGRLFPEYRPAASPTFVPLLHSNSHKKVVEMRSKVLEETVLMDKPAVVSDRTEN